MSNALNFAMICAQHGGLPSPRTILSVFVDQGGGGGGGGGGGAAETPGAPVVPPWWVVPGEMSGWTPWWS